MYETFNATRDRCGPATAREVLSSVGVPKGESRCAEGRMAGRHKRAALGGGDDLGSEGPRLGIPPWTSSVGIRARECLELSP